MRDIFTRGTISQGHFCHGHLFWKTFFQGRNLEDIFYKNENRGTFRQGHFLKDILACIPFFFDFSYFYILTGWTDRTRKKIAIYTLFNRGLFWIISPISMSTVKVSWRIIVLIMFSFSSDEMCLLIVCIYLRTISEDKGCFLFLIIPMRNMYNLFHLLIMGVNLCLRYVIVYKFDLYIYT